ncbi:MAG: T9SS type A sorting domain-containing protein [Lentimicrobiaceae bacterium]|nr:T9SS type A sorting domain-containing protein [Lentimicrobiaceae bacterium]
MRKFFLFIALIISGVGLINAQNFGSTVTIDYGTHSLKFTVTNVDPAECEVICPTNKPTVDFNVVIPEKVVIEGSEFPVTRIGDNAFKPYAGSSYYSRLKSVSIPNTVTTIGNYAFHDCGGLVGITIPNSVTSIGNYAFSYCTGLLGITFPNSVSSIGDYAFRDCDGIIGVTIPNSVETLGHYAFSDCDKLNVVTFEEGCKLTVLNSNVFSYTALTEIEIPNSVTTIGEYAFCYCKSLGNVTIPNSVERIGQYAFQQTALVNVNIPNSVTTIDRYAFGNCTALKTISIPNSVTSMGVYVFGSCSSLESAILPKNITSLSNGIFAYCSKLATITIPKNVTKIGYDAFVNCKSLTTVIFEEGSKLATIADHGGSCYGAFENCTALSNVQLPNSLTYLGSRAFSGCKQITHIEIPNNVTHIAGYAFAQTGLIEIEIPDNVISLGTYVFEACSKLEYISIPKSITEIPSGAFKSCVSLKDMEIPNSITEINMYAFQSCTVLENITIPNSVTAIYSYAFNNCKALEHITIPNSVTTISNGAFNGCSGLKSIEIPSSVTEIGSEAFRYCSKLESVHIANGLKTISVSAFADCIALRDVTLPSTITTLGDKAFNGCGLIERFRCFAMTPPSNKANIFTALTDVMQIQVLESALATYQATTPWKNYTLVAFPDLGSSTIMNFGDYALEFVVTNLERSQCSVRCSTLPTVPTMINIPGEIIINGITFDVATIADNAFANCTYITDINIDNGVKTIGQSAFNGCNAITNVILPESVETIGKSAFANCSNLTGVSLPSSIKNIGEESFSNCKKLASLECKALKVPTTAYNAFNYVPTALSVQVPESSINLYKNAYPWKLYNIMPLSGVGTSLVISYDDYSLKYTITSMQPAECEVVCSNKPSKAATVTIPSTVSIGGNIYSVTSLGNNAFANATNISGIKCHVEEVPATPYNAFDNLPSTMKIQVPEASVSSYQVSSPWNEFDIEAGFHSTITAVSNNTYNGNVSGGGVYNDGSMATLTATPNENCTFVNWSENGTVVSSNAQYSFVVNKDRNLVANFISTNYWNPDYSLYPNNMTIVAIIQIDGIEHSVGTLEIGAFCGEELRGSTRAVYEESLGRYIVYLTVCGNTGDEISFRLYDHIAGKELQFIAPEEITFATNAELGDVNNPHVFNFISQVNVSVASNPVNMGIIEGAGTYTIGDEVTLTATSSSDNYYFVNWTENGNIVSDKAIYTFTIDGDRDLVANFSATNYWNPNTTHYSSSMTIIGVVEVEGVEQRSSNIEIGAFCGNELRGSQRLYYEQDIDRYYLYLMIYGETNDVITFKLYDHSTATESDLSHVENVIFEVNGTLGNLIEPYTFNFLSGVMVSARCNPQEAGTISGTGKYPLESTATLTATANEGFAFKNWTLDGEIVSNEAAYSFVVEQATELVANFNYIQERELSKGWNWYSTYVNVSGSEGLNMMKEDLAESAIQIKGQNNFVNNQNGIWYGQLNGLSSDQMYMIHMSETATLEMTGELIDPSECPITLSTNWKWISYPLNHSMNLVTALSNYTPSNGDYIKSQNNGFAQYYSSLGWRGTLNSLTPGQGYMYQNTSGSVRTLVFADNSTKEMTKENVTTENNRWTPNESKYPTNMTMIAVVESDSDFEVAAFSDGECRGSARPVHIEELGKNIVFMTIYGEGNETINFRYYNINDDEEYVITNTMIFGANATVGDLMDPYVLKLATVNIDEHSENVINIYPNPADRNAEIHFAAECEKVEVYNSLGVKISEYENVSHIDGIETSGVYMIKVIINGDVKYDRIVVR